MAIEAILMSPNFLFRIERDQPVWRRSPRPGGYGGQAAATGVERLRVGDHELASRLVLPLEQHAGRRAVRAWPKQKRLHDPAVLDAQVQRMLADPKAVCAGRELRRAVAEPAADGPDEAGRGEVPEGRRRAARTRCARRRCCSSARSSARIAASSISSTASSRSSTARSRATTAFPGVDGEEFQRVELDGEQRSGILTQASILTISSYATRTSPVHSRQVGARQPAGRGAAAAARRHSAPGRDRTWARPRRCAQRLEQHRANPSCAACHNPMDPIGFEPRELRRGRRLAHEGRQLRYRRVRHAARRTDRSPAPTG